MEFTAEGMQKLGLLMQFAENDKSPAAKACMSLLQAIAEDVKGLKGTGDEKMFAVGKAAVDFLEAASDLKDPVYEGIDPMLKQSLQGMFKTVRMMIEE